MKRIPLYKCKYCGNIFEKEQEIPERTIMPMDVLVYPEIPTHICFEDFIGVTEFVGWKLIKEEGDK